MSWLGRNRRWLLLLAAILIPIGLVVAFVLPDWLWHPVASQDCAALYHTTAQIRDCKSYNWHSGLEGNLQEITLVAAIVIFWLKHNCYVNGCPRIGRVKGDDGHLRCKGHHKATHPDYAQ